MKRLVTYIVNVDEDVAEPAYIRALDVMNSTIPHILVNKKSVFIEPHDDYRGIYARVELQYKGLSDEKNKKMSMTVVDAIKDLIKMQLWYIPSIQVSSEIGDAK